MFYRKVLFFVVFPIFVLTSCTNEYWLFHKQKEILETEKQQIIESLQNFSVAQIEPRDVEILTTPDKKVLDRIVSMIDEAKRQVFVEVYIFTEKRIIQALKDAKKR